MSKDYLLDVMLLCQTSHDADSVSIHRLRANNYSVVERARPRNLDASLSVNHGGVAIAAVAGIRLKEINVGVTPLTFEYVAARVTIGHSSCFVVVVYRPGSSVVTTNFFTELSDLLDCLSTLTDPLVTAGDINIRLERASDANTITFGDLIASYGLTQLVSGITHDGGGTLDVVCVRDDQPLPPIEVLDIGLSDHRLLSWNSCLPRPSPIYVTSTTRPWRSFNHEAFRVGLLTSELCNQLQWNQVDGNSLVHLYHVTITSLLDEQIPVSSKTCRRRTSNAWFDDDCRRAKQLLRASERLARRTKQLSDNSIRAVANWRDERRKYFNLLHHKRSIFWQQRVDADRDKPHCLWKSFVEILGRGHAAPTEMGANILHQYFDTKIADVRAATDGAALPVFNPAPPGCKLQSFSSVTEDGVTKLVLALPDKQCSSDPMPTRLLKANIDLLAPFLCRLFCWSLDNGSVPSTLN